MPKTKEELAEYSFNESTRVLLVNGDQPQLRAPDDITIAESLYAQTQALLGVGYMLEAILQELRMNRHG